MLVILAVLALSLTGCGGSRGGSVPYDVKSFGAPDLPQASAAQPAYHIGPGDVLAITVFRVPDLSGEFAVTEGGSINLPLLGEIVARGKTPDELTADLEKALGAKYLQNPDVQVALKASSSQKITVDGSVNQPGIFPIAGPTTLIQAVALARGTDKDANTRRVVVFRTIDGQRQAAAFDLTDIRRGDAPDPTIYGNDIIVVDGSKSRQMFRDFISSVPLLSVFRPF